MSISVIIPTYNEAGYIAETIEKISANSVQEILVVDGGSGDKTLSKARTAGAKTLKCPQKGRAVQMNYGARHARGKILYFLHADTHPPSRFATCINRAIADGYDAGCFQLSFDDDHFLLQFYSWFTRFDIDAFRFGDQSLFVDRNVFSDLRGFQEDHMMMEGQDMVRRIKNSYSFVLLDDTVTTSARKYRRQGIVKLQLVFFLIFCLHYLGISQQNLVYIYNGLLY